MHRLFPISLFFFSLFPILDGNFPFGNDVFSIKCKKIHPDVELMVPEGGPVFIISSLVPISFRDEACASDLRDVVLTRSRPEVTPDYPADLDNPFSSFSSR